MRRVLGRFRRPDPGQLAVLAASAAAGALGALPGASGALDPVAVLGWMALFAPAAGALCGARGIALVPLGVLVPVLWTLFLAALQAGGARGFSALVWGACALAGLFALGLALGARTRSALLTAGALLLSGLLLASAAPGFGLLAGGSELARSHPRLAARLLDGSPVVLVFECAGWDWVHAQPEVYARGGAEWIQRRPYPGNLAGPAVLVVGCALAILARRPDRLARAPG
jgi:hypothetical protein